MDRGNRGFWPHLLVGGVVGGLLVLVGTSSRGSAAAVRGLLPASTHEQIALAGLALLGVVVLMTALLVALKTTVFLLSLLFTGREALDQLPDVDPLVGGSVGVVVVAALVVGGGAVLTSGAGAAGGDLPYLDEAFGGGATNPHGIVADDELEGFGRTGESLPEYPDADGDRLPDAWERAGETPAGVPLPGADPRRKDLYVQLNYANGHPPLNASERRALERIWADMPVANPDGSTGIDIHVVDDGAGAGRMDDRVVIDSGGFGADFIERYYAPEYVGARGCTHYLVIFGDVQGQFDGWGLTPGYLSVVDGAEHGRVAGTSGRVTVLTHELLHNVAGQLGTGGYHVDRGWLAGGDGEFAPAMSQPVREDLERNGFARAPGFETQLCDEPVGATAGGDGS